MDDAYYAVDRGTICQFVRLVILHILTHTPVHDATTRTCIIIVGKDKRYGDENTIDTGQSYRGVGEEQCNGPRDNLTLLTRL